MKMKYAVKIHDDGRCETVSWDTDAGLRMEVMGSLHTSSPEYAPLFGDMMLAFQHRDSLECVRAGDKSAHLVENAVASELAGFSRPSDDRVYGPAYVVAAGDRMSGIPQAAKARRLTEALSSIAVPARRNTRWSGGLAYVEELAPGKGFAYFMYGSENPGAFVGWDREPRFMYAEPPFDTLRASVDVVGYIAPGLVVGDRETSVTGMSSGGKAWLSSRDGSVSFGADTTVDGFVEALRGIRGAKVFTEK